MLQHVHTTVLLAEMHLLLDLCNAPTGGVRPDVGEEVRLLGKSTGSYGEPKTTRGVH